jgi:hypothetical protein
MLMTDFDGLLDVYHKIMEIIEQGWRSLCILSAGIGRCYK